MTAFPRTWRDNAAGSRTRQATLQEGKRFFFEKKNQKTFIGLSPVSPERGTLKRMKVFCFFSSEKKCFLPFY
jgi:hypothetical protein